MQHKKPLAMGAMVNAANKVLLTSTGKTAQEHLTSYLKNVSLYNAAFDGDFRAVMNFLHLEADPDFNEANEDGDTPLITAAFHGHTAIAQLLLGRKADINQTNTSGTTPLMIAAQNGKIETVKLLLDRGAKPDIRHPDGNFTALHLAAKEGLIEIVALLLDPKYKTDIEATTDDGATALHYAAQYGHRDATKYLIAKGAKQTPRTNEGGLTPLSLALDKGHTKVAIMMIELGVSLRDLNGDDHANALHVAAQFNALDVIDVILQRDPTLLNETLHVSEATALHIATSFNHSAVISKLLAHGADTRKRLANNGPTPLTLAILNGNLPLADLFIEHGADINERMTQDGMTALHLSIHKNNRDLVAWLLERHADTEQWDSIIKQTPLSLAFEMKATEIVEMIIQKIIQKGTVERELGALLTMFLEQDKDESITQLITIMQKNKIANHVIDSILPTAHKGNPELKDTSRQTKIIPKRSQQTQLKNSQLPLFKPTTRTKNKMATGNCEEKYEPLRQQLLTMAFDPNTPLGRHLQMHGSKGDYGMDETTSNHSNRLK